MFMQHDGRSRPQRLSPACPAKIRSNGMSFVRGREVDKPTFIFSGKAQLSYFRHGRGHLTRLRHGREQQGPPEPKIGRLRLNSS